MLAQALRNIVDDCIHLNMTLILELVDHFEFVALDLGSYVSP